jgi:hypothetical protein
MDLDTTRNNRCIANRMKRPMKSTIRLLTTLMFLAVLSTLVYFLTENNRLAAELDRLEAELGKMVIKDVNRVHIVEIAAPDVPPEVASHIEGVWQFRCYLPKKYNYMQMTGGGRVTAEGLYQSGGFSSNWGSPPSTSIQSLMTMSFQKKDNRLVAFYSFSGSHGTTSWNNFNPDRLATMVVQKLVDSKKGPRSFDQDTILPLLKIYDPTTAKNKEIDGTSITTYEGGHFVLCPKSLESCLQQLREGKAPDSFNPNWVATAVVDE